MGTWPLWTNHVSFHEKEGRQKTVTNLFSSCATNKEEGQLTLLWPNGICSCLGDRDTERSVCHSLGWLHRGLELQALEVICGPWHSPALCPSLPAGSDCRDCSLDPLTQAPFLCSEVPPPAISSLYSSENKYSKIPTGYVTTWISLIKLSSLESWLLIPSSPPQPPFQDGAPCTLANLARWDSFQIQHHLGVCFLLRTMQAGSSMVVPLLVAWLTGTFHWNLRIEVISTIDLFLATALAECLIEADAEAEM